ncbi:putative neural-cadherin 2 [Armadillidium vulgare]|nr:putative neural-cadherin 2 [Armadillidium vulgare]
MVRIIDVNDNPPNLASSKHVLVLENSPPHVIGDIKLDDPDDWTLGHGPPFTLLMDPDASLDVKKKFTVSFNKDLGIGTIKSLVSLDREYSSIIPIPLLVSDSGFPPQTTTLTIEAIVADVNDNPMEAAQKHITVYALQPLRSNVPLGRVFVRDPDDWDASEKTYFWSQPHPLFLLNTSSGELEMKPDARPGRYNLGFRVNDAKHNQIGVSANVSVEVKSLTHGDLKTTNPLVIKMEPFKLLYSHFSICKITGEINI